MGSSELAKLTVLLKHWVEHNREHSEEFSAWADKAKTFGHAEAGKEMIKAAREMNKASEFLSRALRILSKEP